MSAEIEHPSSQVRSLCSKLKERVDDHPAKELSGGSGEDQFVSWIAGCLLENADWLQARPRDVTEIVHQLFPQYSEYQEDLERLAPSIESLLWDSGYSPRQGCSAYRMWHWTEGRALSGSQNALRNRPSEEVTPPLFIIGAKRWGEMYIGIDTEDVFNERSVRRQSFVHNDAAAEEA